MAGEDLLVAVDGSANAERAVAHAISLVKSGVAKRLHLLNVQPPLDGVGDPGAKVLQAAEKMCAAASIASRSHLETGQPAAAIVEAAQRFGCRSIVLGTRGRTGIAEALLGSVAQDVVGRGQIPVWLVK